MSLDLYINSKTPVLHRGTGVYIRENGETKELETKDEVLKHFPDTNPDNIKETSYEDNEYFHINITHNLTEMADQCEVTGSCDYNLNKENSFITLYDLLWHPKDNLNIEVPTLDYFNDVVACYRKLLENPDFFKQYNPANGWGSYEGLVKKTKEFIAALTKISDNFDNYTIEASV